MKIRNSSRITAIVLALVMLLPLISIPTFAEVDPSKILFSEDFSSYEGLPKGIAAKMQTSFTGNRPTNVEAITQDENTYLRFPMEIILPDSGAKFDGLDFAIMVSGKYVYWHETYPHLVATSYDAESKKLTFTNTEDPEGGLVVDMEGSLQGNGDFIYYGTFKYNDVTYRVATPSFAYVAWIGDSGCVDKYANIYFGEKTFYTAEDPEVLNETKKVGDVKSEPAGYSYADRDKIVITYKAMIESGSSGVLNMQMNQFKRADGATQNFVELGNLDLATATWSGGALSGATFPKDQWFDLYFVVDLKNATIEGIYNGKLYGSVPCGDRGTGGIIVNSWTISKLFKANYFEGVSGAWCIDDFKVLDATALDGLLTFQNYTNDFESQNIGDTIGSLTGAPSVYKVAADPKNPSNKVWALQSSKDGGVNNNNPRMAADAYKTSLFGDKLTISADYYIPAGAQTQLQTQFLTVSGKKDSTESAKNWGDIYVVKSKDGVLTVGREGNPTIATLNYNEWFTVAVEFTLSTNTYDVYVGKNMVFGGQKIAAGGVTFDEITSIDANQIIVAKENSAAKDWVTGTVYLDNLKMYTGEYAGAFKTGDSWSEDELYADLVALDLDNAEVADQGAFSMSDAFTFPNSLVFVDEDEDLTPDAVKLEISDAAGNLDLMVRPNHVGVSPAKVAKAVLSADYTLSEDAEGIIQIQLHTTSPMAWGHLIDIDATNGTVNNFKITKGQKFNITMVMTFATGEVLFYCNNVFVGSKVENMVKDGLSYAEWSVAKVMKDCESYAGSIVVDNMSIETVLADTTDNPLYLYEQVGMVSPDELVSTVDAASIRLFAPTGLRFAAEITDASLLSSATNIGMLIAPADYVAAADDVFTKEALDKLGYVTNYIDVKAEVGNYYMGNGSTADLGEGTYITASIVNILAKNITRDFAAIAYIEIAGEIYYADTYHVANVQDIAAAALASGDYTGTPYESILTAYAAGEQPAY